MSDKKISDLVELTTLAADDVLPVVDASANATKRITGANLSNFPTQPTFDGHDVYHQGNVVGTVSEASGDVTGAVIERDSNSNGEYVKFADGTMICTLDITVTDQSISGAYGSLYQGTRGWTYPVPFAAVPSVSCGLGKFGTQASWSGMSSSNSSNAILRFWDIAPRSTGTTMRISAIAIGRWF